MSIVNKNSSNNIKSYIEKIFCKCYKFKIVKMDCAVMNFSPSIRQLFYLNG